MGSTTPYDRVTEAVYLGPRIETRATYDQLRRDGVRACVDLKQEGADPWGFEAFLWLPTPDHEAPSHLHLRVGLAFLGRCEKAGIAVFVGCQEGVGRSSTLVLAHLLASRFRSAEPRAALDYLVARRSAARPNPEQIEAARMAAFAFCEAEEALAAAEARRAAED